MGNGGRLRGGGGIGVRRWMTHTWFLLLAAMRVMFLF